MAERITDSSQDEFNKTLFDAIENGQEDLVEKLIECGADVNAANKYGRTALFYAVGKENYEIAEKLIEFGADVNATDEDGSTALFHAVNEEVVQKLIECGADVNAVDEDGETALFYAVRKGNEKIAKKLIQCGADVDATDEDGETSLFHAVNEEMVQKLVECGADVNAVDEDGETALFYAVRKGDEKIVDKLIQCGADVNAVDEDGETALFHAVRKENVKIVEILIQCGTEVNATDEDGSTPLFFAVNEEVVQKLIECSADVHAANKDGRTALIFAVNEEVAQKLIECGADVNATDKYGAATLFYAVQKENEKMVGKLIECAADVNAVDEYSQTALFYAVEKENEKIVEKLIECGADVNAANKYGETVLFYAVEKENENIVEKLIKCGADVNATNKDGKTALYHAVQKESEIIVEKLIECGADVNAANKYGETVLFHAVQNENERMVEELINCGADVNATHKHGRTSLFNAVGEKKEKIVKKLVQCGADINATNVLGFTALSFAVLKENKEVVEKLIECGADVNAKNEHGKTPLFYAVQRGNEEVVEKLIKCGADVNAANEWGQTVFSYAVEKGSKKMAEKLIECVADVNESDEDGETALFNAVQNESTKTVKKLIECAADVNESDEDGETALFQAVMRGNKEVVGNLIKCRADVNATDKSGRNALFYAVQQSNDESVVRTLIDAGTDVNITDNEGKTALFFLNSHDEACLMARLLIEDGGAQVDVRDRYGRTPLFYAMTQSLSLARYLLDKGATLHLNENCSVLTFFIENCIFDLSQKTSNLEDGLNLLSDCKEVERNTILEAIASVAFCKALYLKPGSCDIDVGSLSHLMRIANENASNFKYFQVNFPVGKIKTISEISTMIHEQSHDKELIKTGAAVEVIRRLINLGANPNTTDLDGNSALHHATQLAFHGVTRDSVMAIFLQLKKFNALFHIKNHQNETPLLYCLSKTIEKVSREEEPWPAFKTQGAVCRFLVEHGSSVEANTRSGENVLQLTIKLLHHGFFKRNSQSRKDVSDVALELLEIIAGSNPNTIDSDGNTCLHHATQLAFHGVTQESVIKICKQLEKFNVSFHITNHQDETPLLYCLTRTIEKVSREEEPWPAVHIQAAVCRFLVEHGSSVEAKTGSGENVLQLAIKLLHHGFFKRNSQSRKDVSDVAIELMEVFVDAFKRHEVSTNTQDNSGNTPLHLWAKLKLAPGQNYSSNISGGHTFRGLLKIILDHFRETKELLYVKNENGETPLHLCRTWTAVELLLDAGANPNDEDSSGHTPLLVAVRKNESVENRGSLYPDILPDPETFWTNVLKKGLDPWSVDIRDESVLSVLLESESHDLARALVHVACNDLKVRSCPLILYSLLTLICKDKLPNAHWKKDAAERILSSTKCQVNGNDNEDSPLHYCCRNIVKATLPLSSEEIKTTVHWSMVRVLRSFGGDYRIPDASGQSCLDMAKECPALKDLLMEPIDLDRFPVFIKPWKSVSKTHERCLANVARHLESEHVKSYWYHKDHLASGSFGAVFAGINEKDGREVAIKRIEKIRMQRPEDKREITNLTALANCEQVVFYLQFFEDKHFSYIVLELMEGNLDHFLNTAIQMETKVSLCQDIVQAMKFLHDQNILHRDLKPTNILYKTTPKLCLKIADFGLSRRMDNTGSSTSVYGSNVGTRCWIAPEVLTSQKPHSKSSDVFACGLVLHYILSVKKHPFVPILGALQHEIEANIQNGNMEGWDNSLCPEVADLLKAMLDGDKSKRPSADKALDHPFFWSKKKKLDLLVALGNQPEFECPRAKKRAPLTAVETDLEASFGTIVKYVDWNDPSYAHMPAIYTEMTKKRKRYDTSSVVELVRLIRNAYAHVTALPKSIQDQLLKDFVFLEYFPNLVMEVYTALIIHGWDQTREEIKYALQ